MSSPDNTETSRITPQQLYDLQHDLAFLRYIDGEPYVIQDMETQLREGVANLGGLEEVNKLLSQHSPRYLNELE